MTTRLALALVLALLSSLPVCGAAPAAARTSAGRPELTPACDLRGGATVAFTSANPGRLPLAKATVNGVEGVFLVDTGASISVLSPEFADKARLTDRLTQPGASVNGVAGGVSFARVTQLRVGGARFSGFHALLMDLGHLESGLGAKPAGILGANVLLRAPLTLDYVAGVATWNGPEPKGAVALPAEFSKGGVFVKGDLDGVKLPLLLDTGASVNAILEGDWPGPRREAGVNREARAHGAQEAKVVVADVRRASFGGLSVSAPEFRLNTTHRCLGAPFFAGSILHLDASKRRVLMWKGAPVAAPGTIR